MDNLLKFLVNYITNIDEILDKIKSCLETDISPTEMRLGSMEGPGGITSRLLNYLSRKLTNIIHRAMHLESTTTPNNETLLHLYTAAKHIKTIFTITNKKEFSM